MEDILLQGIQAAQNGERARALTLLAHAVQENPNAEQGWLWLGHCLEEVEKRRFCYRKVLAINPDNQEAPKWLVQLTLPTAPPPSAPEYIPAPAETISPPASKAIQSPDKPLQPAAAPVAASAKPKPKQKRRNRGLLIAFLICLVAGLAFYNYSLNFRSTELFKGLTIFKLVTITPESVSAPDTNSDYRPQPPAIGTPTLQSPATTLPGLPTPNPETLMANTERMDEAKTLIEQEQYYAAISLIDKILREDPQNDEAYYQKALCYYKLKTGDGYLGRAQFNIGEALKNIDHAILLKADVSDYYLLRNSLYSEIASVSEYEVDREYLINIALDNAEKAYSLEPNSNEYVEASFVSGLIYTNRCAEAQDKLEALMDKTPLTDDFYFNLLQIQSQVAACLGKLGEAMEAIESSMENGQNLYAKKELKIGYLYQLEQYDKALPLLAELFDCCEYHSGMRYYIRAAIYYKTGKKELALEDLELGKQNTWLRSGMLPYVEAQIALDTGQLQEGIKLLQIAEATFDPLFNTMRWKAQNQLKELGTLPLSLVPASPYRATPIP